MSKDNRTISIREFGRIYANEVYDGTRIYKKDIDELRAFIDEQNSKDFDDQSTIDRFLRPIKNGVQANNYVGVLQTQSGLTIEILPKIIGRTGEASVEKVRKLFLTMLKTVKHVNGKSFKMAHLNVSRNNILEIFIAMFLTEVDTIIKRGIKSSYVTIQSNEKFLKGKLLMTQHIRKNTVNQSSFYNEYDEFLANGPENQIIKTTLEFLLSRSRSSVNQRLIREQLAHFEFVDTVNAHEQVFQRVQAGRYYKYYEQALEWAKVFLSRKSYTSFRGKSMAFAILFPMEEIFEAYIAQLLKRNLQNARVSAQDKRYFLFDKTLQTRASYRLRPDLVIRHSEIAQTTIADTKWKVLDKTGPSQSDLYQMYAYYTRYQHKGEAVDRVVLLYPYTEAYQEAEFQSLMQLSGSEELTAKIQVSFIDLLSDDDTIEKQLTALFN